MGGVHSIKRSGGCRLRLERRRGGGSALDGGEVDVSSRIGVSVRASVPVSDTGICITSVPSGDEGVKTEGFSSVEVTSSSVGITSAWGARCRMDTVVSRPSGRRA